jgi:hypothetical protein
MVAYSHPVTIKEPSEVVKTFRKEEITYETRTIEGNIQHSRGSILRSQLTGHQIDSFITLRTEEDLQAASEEDDAPSTIVVYKNEDYLIREKYNNESEDPDAPLPHFKYVAYKSRPLKNELS